MWQFSAVGGRVIQLRLLCSSRFGAIPVTRRSPDSRVREKNVRRFCTRYFVFARIRDGRLLGSRVHLHVHLGRHRRGPALLRAQVKEQRVSITYGCANVRVCQYFCWAKLIHKILTPPPKYPQKSFLAKPFSRMSAAPHTYIYYTGSNHQQFYNLQLWFFKNNKFQASLNHRAITYEQKLTTRVYYGLLFDH
jgi:hypothetical protein